MNKPVTILVERFAGVGTWTFATIPFDCEKEFGKKGKIDVKGQINNHDIQATLMPRGNGEHFIILTKEIRKKCNINVGDNITVTLQLDTSSKIIETPTDFALALNKQKEALEFYNNLAPSHKKEFVKWITEAKKEETRQNRIAKAIEKLKEREKLR